MNSSERKMTAMLNTLGNVADEYLAEGEIVPIMVSFGNEEAVLAFTRIEDNDLDPGDCVRLLTHWGRLLPNRVVGFVAEAYVDEAMSVEELADREPLSVRAARGEQVKDAVILHSTDGLRITSVAAQVHRRDDGSRYLDENLLEDAQAIGGDVAEALRDAALAPYPNELGETSAADVCGAVTETGDLLRALGWDVTAVSH